jgi:hypothetical protein
MTPDDPRLPPPDDPGADLPDPAAGGSPAGGRGASAGGAGGDSRPSGPAGSDGGNGDADELASALLDGVLDEAGAAAARQRSDVMARLAEIESTRAALRDAPARPPDPIARERAIAAALAAFDDQVATPPTPAGEPVKELAARQQRRRAPRHGAPRWLGAAAAVAVLAAAAAGVATLGTNSSDDDAATSEDATAGGEARETEEDASGGAADAPAASEGADDQGAAEEPGSVAPLVAGDLGSFASADDLVANLRTRADEDRESSNATDGSGEAVAPADEVLADLRFGCGTGLPGRLEEGGTVVRLRGTATFLGDPVDVLVIRTTGGDRVVAIDASCSVVVDEPLG